MGLLFNQNVTNLDLLTKEEISPQMNTQCSIYISGEMKVSLLSRNAN